MTASSDCQYMSIWICQAIEIVTPTSLEHSADRVALGVIVIEWQKEMHIYR